MAVVTVALSLACIVAASLAFAIDHFYRRQPWIPRTRIMATSISDKVFALCHEKDTVSSLLAEDPSLKPADAARQLYGRHGFSIYEGKLPAERRRATDEELERARRCGRFGDTKPSELFLRVWHDALCTLENDPLAGVVSPPLMGSTGVIPLTVISSLPDICRHMANLIARADKEVFLATNYWKESDASRLITDAMKELSKRAGARGKRAVVKVIYDRGSVKQVADNHLQVNEKDRTLPGVALPSQEEIPNIDMEVVNYHRPVLGTFHAKFMIVDRRIGILCSNNIQDNDNLEMMTHCEGPIVDSLYDMALLTWHEALNPPLPLLGALTTKRDSVLTTDTSSLVEIVDSTGGLLTAKIQHVNDSGERLPEDAPGDPHYDADIAGEILRLQSALTPAHGERVVDLVAQHLNASTHQTLTATAPDCAPEDAMTPYIAHAPHAAFPIALVNRRPFGALSHASINTPQNEAWLSAIRHAQRSIFIQSPDINAEPLLPALVAAVRRGVDVTLFATLGYNDLGELLPAQGGTNEMVAHGLYAALDGEERDRLKVCWYVGKDQLRPLHNAFKRRSCHIPTSPSPLSTSLSFPANAMYAVKLLIADGHIAIQGSGNQDTQSWFHSQETNILIDSEAVCHEWLDALRRNQNTHLFGEVCRGGGGGAGVGAGFSGGKGGGGGQERVAGVWYDDEGKEAEGALGVNPGRFSWVKGVVGAVQRVRGTGGF
ncbi:uncharacterized protein K452DRAFT_360026 [Aplosporella prunicola CBS 121167]|uniref:PLD phosphodiesterase domain-containing protein n=1 Tax=Aplosporella prunicola CBS 121167 TaxID=1176127 RepID=A0A6A6BAN3_9PEZI|nr:uncharacterized protein K452DRAFT_360026 [Aplosporella prunicola CBS 121167]KAF2140413.1 hypothetical protein K452DRAFT_360026 [Aplosporella prunicola CBS 121167]